MSDRSDWRQIITVPAGQAPHRLEQLALQRLIGELAPPGTVLTATLFNLYATAVNQATADLVDIIEQPTFMRSAPEPKPAACPTPCDPDCTDACHEDHLPRWKREHQPDDCPGYRPQQWPFWRIRSTATWLGAKTREVPSMAETAQAVINDLAARGIRLVVPGYETPGEPE